MVCLCGDSECSCSKNCSSTTAICSCMKNRFKLEASPSSKIPTLSHSQERKFSDAGKASIPKSSLLLENAEIDGSSKSTIPDETKSPKLKTGENSQHRVQGATGDSQFPNSEEFDCRFAQTVQGIILNQGLQPSESATIRSKSIDDNLLRIAECEYAKYTSSYERTRENLAHDLQKETSNDGKRPHPQKSSRHLEETDAVPAKRNKLQSPNAKNGHQDWQRNYKDDSPENSAASPSIFMTEEMRELPSTSKFPAVSHFPSIFQALDLETSALPCDRNISPNNFDEELTLEDSPLGVLNEIFGGDRNVKTIHTADDQHVSHSMNEVDEPGSSAERVQTEELTCSTLDQLQDLTSSYYQIMNNFNYGDAMQQKTYPNGIETEKNSILSRLQELSASLHSDISTEMLNIQTSEN